MRRHLTPEELSDTLKKVISFTPLSGLPKLIPGWWAFGDGIFETLHTNRMRITPNVIFPYLPDDAEFIVLDQNEVITRIQFLHKGTDRPYPRIFPFMVAAEFDAEF